MKTFDKVLVWLFIAALIYLLPVTIIRAAWQKYELRDDWKGGDTSGYECVANKSLD